MDEIDPRNHTIHTMIDGEHLVQERAYWANQPCRVMPWHLTNAAVCLAILIAIGAALYAANEALGVGV
jgi:hypothetical protein